LRPTLGESAAAIPSANLDEDVALAATIKESLRVSEGLAGSSSSGNGSERLDTTGPITEERWRARLPFIASWFDDCEVRTVTLM
jgi:hypothetical protein